MVLIPKPGPSSVVPKQSTISLHLYGSWGFSLIPGLPLVTPEKPVTLLHIGMQFKQFDAPNSILRSITKELCAAIIISCVYEYHKKNKIDFFNYLMLIKNINLFITGFFGLIV
jgi:hypothetical protein